MVALISWLVVGVIAVLSTVGILGVAVTSLMLGVQRLSARRTARHTAAAALPEVAPVI